MMRHGQWPSWARTVTSSRQASGRAATNESALPRGALQHIVAHANGFRVAVRTRLVRGPGFYPGCSSIGFCLRLYWFLFCRLASFLALALRLFGCWRSRNALSLFFSSFLLMLRQSLASDVVGIPQPCRVIPKSIRVAHHSGSISPR